MKKVYVWMLFIVVLLFPMVGSAQFGDPFTVSAEIRDGSVFVEVGVPDKHYLYADHFKATDAAGNELKAEMLPDPVSISDPNTGKPKPVYDKAFKVQFKWAPQAGGEAAAHVSYWGCNDQVCFIPQTKVVEVPGIGNTADAMAGKVPDLGNVATGTSSDWKNELENFQTLGNTAGYMGAKDFLGFMDRAEGNGKKVNAFRLFLTDPVAFMRESGLLLTVLFILFGGFLLNLTPCVLPMIPINLAIIGAGAQAGSRGRGFALGGVYGLGIALVYGLLGVVAAMTGASFGTLQSTAWFNFSIAVIFLVLALAMFDLFHIDLTRFQSKMGSGSSEKKGSFLLALTMGSVAALLAGACVAPVVIAVLLLASNMGTSGLILPFVLGLGMALPWPFAGAGLSFLPKPGKWMEYVKYGFGVLIILFALYYAHLGYRAMRPAEVADAGTSSSHLMIDGSTNEGFAELLRGAHAAGQPVFIDFWASWCKNCKAMEKVTFKDEAVKARLDKYLFIKYISEDPNDPLVKEIWNHFEVQGLPTFVVLEPKK